MRFWYQKILPSVRYWLQPLGWIYRILQQPFIASFLFVGLIYFWLCVLA